MPAAGGSAFGAGQGTRSQLPFSSLVCEAREKQYLSCFHLLVTLYMLSIPHMLSFPFQSDTYSHFPGEETYDRKSNLDRPGLVQGRTAGVFQAGVIGF